MLTVTQVHKTYATPQGPLTILDDVSLTLARGDSAAIMGPSGSGKSTLLYVVGALEPPTSGQVRLDGHDPYALRETELAALRNRHVGFVFQDHCLLPQLSVLENVLAPALVADDWRGGRTYIDRASTLLERVGLAERLAHRPAELSGGEKQRVAVARALIRRPTLLLCDEPTGNLDERNAAVVADLLVSLHQSEPTILIVVTHSPAIAARCSRRYALSAGRLATA